MFNLGKSKKYQIAQTLLKNSGFFHSDFKLFHIKEIINAIVEDSSLLVSLVEVIKQANLKPLRILKIQLLVHNLLQVDSNMQQNKILLQLLMIIEAKVKKILKSSATSDSINITCDDKNTTQNHQSKKLSSSICQNQTTLLLGKIIQPMLLLQKRLIFSYDLIQPPAQAEGLEISSCWPLLNHLKKFVQISPNIQIIGRYFSQKYAVPMVYLIKVLDADIQVLYQRIKDFIARKMGVFYDLLILDRLQNVSENVRLQMNEFLQLIREVEIVTEYLRHFYLSRYFIQDIIKQRITMPSLFTTENDLDLLRQIRKNVQRKKRPSRSLFKKKSLHFTQEVFKTV